MSIRSTFLLIVLSLVALSGCNIGTPQPVTRAWTEDVLLDDGSTIQVRRTVTFDESDSWSGDAYNAVEKDATIMFTGALSRLPPWRQPLMALLLYRDATSDEWVIVATTTSCDVWRQRGKPAPLYWEFRLHQQGWREVPLAKGSHGRHANLLHRYQQDLRTDHITAVDRQQRESSPTMGNEFREIVSHQEIHCGR